MKDRTSAQLQKDDLPTQMQPLEDRIRANLRDIHRHMEDACASAGRPVDAVKLVVVTKSAGMDAVRALVEMGQTELGENRVQQLIRRAGAVAEWLETRSSADPPLRPPQWHMIGHLQRNKVKQVLPYVQTIHSLDTIRLAEEVSDHAAKLGRAMDVLLEVNVSGEPSKFGTAVDKLKEFAEQAVSLPWLELRGLMTMAPFDVGEPEAYGVFAKLRDLFDELRGSGAVGPRFTELSMGMSGDFVPAIRAGSTIVRIGTAVFEGIAGIGTT